MAKTAAKLGDKLVKKTLPRFVEMVDTAIENKNMVVAIHPDSFNCEPELMYAAVYYAIHKGVMVTFYNGHGPHPLDRPLKGNNNAN